MCGVDKSMVRVWLINPELQVLECIMKEHKNAGLQIRINKSDSECFTARWDVKWIVWDLK